MKPCWIALWVWMLSAHAHAGHGVESVRFRTPTAYALYALVMISAALLGSLLWRLRARWREREQARAQIEASEKRLKVVLSTSGCELWVADLAKKRMVRESALSQLGPDPGPEGTLTADMMARLHPDDQVRFQHALGNYVQGLSPRFEMVYRVRVDDSYIWLRSVGHVQERSPDGRMRIISGTTFEVSELKESELKLQQLNEELGQRVAELETARRAIIEVDKRRKLALWGSGCEFFEALLEENKLLRENRTIDLAANDVGDALSDYWPYLHPEDMEGFSKEFIKHVKGETEFYDVTYRAKRHDGSWAWIQTRGRAVSWNSEGRVSVIAGTNYEVSELKENERKLQQLAEDLEQRVEARTRDLSQTLEELKRTQRQLVDSEKMAALGGLVAGVAHEINTPLGIGVTAASHLSEQSEKLRRKLASGGLKKSDIEDFVSASCQATDLVMVNLRRASELIKSFKQVAVDQSSEQRRLIELKPYIHEILNSMRPTLKRVAHQVEVTCPDHLLWDTYPGALYQIVMNLIMNSLNHAFAEVEQGQMQLIVRVDGRVIELTYTDDGVGMSEEICKRVFEPFFTTKRGQGGSGLGLHIVFNLVTQVLGGSIELFSAPGQGARFVIRAPTERASLSTPPSSRQP